MWNAVVDRAVAVGLAVPRLEAVEDALAGALHREVDDRRGAAPRRRSRARLEGVGRGGAAERQLHVGVRVDAAGNDVLPARVDDPVRRRREVAAERASDPGCTSAAICSPSMSTSMSTAPLAETTVPLVMSVVIVTPP